MSNYNVYDGFGSSSKTLPGAISPKQVLACSEKQIDEEKKLRSDYDIVDEYVSPKFKTNEDFYYNENGAVLNAFKLSDDINQKEKEIRIIMLHYLDHHPEYEVEVKEGEFPIHIDKELVEIKEKKYKIKEITMSNYVLYIKNYQDFLTNSKII